MAGAICEHGKIRTTCAACRIDPRRDFLARLGPVPPHALAQVVAEGAMKIERLPHLEALGERAKDPAPRAPTAAEWDFLKEAVIERDGRRCQACGDNERLRVDHILPPSKGGSNTPRNLWTLCAECQTVKTGRASQAGPSTKRPAKSSGVGTILKGRDMVFRD